MRLASMSSAFGIAILLFGLTTPSFASAQTVRDIANRGACSTSGVQALSQQLADAQACLRPGAFVRFAPHSGITLSSSRIHAFAQASARDAIWAAAARTPLTINSAFRTLADQYVLYYSGACGLAATPGRSNHQSGRAVDVDNYSSAQSALTSAGCAWLGSSDPVHFDCPGIDLRSDSVLAFQRLWNRNHPSDRIAEDGLYGPQTESRLAQAPASGFAQSACQSCTPACMGDGYVDAQCALIACPSGEICDASGSPRCVARPPTTGIALGLVYADQGGGIEDTSMRIANATIRVLALDRAAVSDSSGVFRLELEAGDYTLRASANGYRNIERECAVVSGATTWCSLGMLAEARMSAPPDAGSSSSTGSNPTDAGVGVLYPDAADSGPLDASSDVTDRDAAPWTRDAGSGEPRADSSAVVADRPSDAGPSSNRPYDERPADSDEVPGTGLRGSNGCSVRASRDSEPSLPAGAGLVIALTLTMRRRVRRRAH